MTDLSEITRKPLILKVQPRPSDQNLRGDVFGGWLLNQLDIAGGITATSATKGMTVTRAIKELTFLKPLFVYDLVSFFTEVVAIGKTSITIKVDAVAERATNPSEIVHISSAVMVFVAMNKIGEKRVIEL